MPLIAPEDIGDCRRVEHGNDCTKAGGIKAAFTVVGLFRLAGGVVVEEGVPIAGGGNFTPMNKARRIDEGDGTRFAKAAVPLVAGDDALNRWGIEVAGAIVKMLLNCLSGLPIEVLKGTGGFVHIVEVDDHFEDAMIFHVNVPAPCFRFEAIIHVTAEIDAVVGGGDLEIIFDEGKELGLESPKVELRGLKNLVAGKMLADLVFLRCFLLESGDMLLSDVKAAGVEVERLQGRAENAVFLELLECGDVGWRNGRESTGILNDRRLMDFETVGLNVARLV
jgi:hypothetical protein